MLQHTSCTRVFVPYTRLDCWLDHPKPVAASPLAARVGRVSTTDHHVTLRRYPVDLRRIWVAGR